MRGLLIGIGIAVAIWLVAVIVLIALGRRSQARELRAITAAPQAYRVPPK